jgi:nitroimidazol reductase NimA-like FMN-containing flavoprotein (pyridoxamine 5'-phosphate oxidase superfamily)
MTQEEIDEFLNLRLVGALAILRDDGTPSVLPIWYRWDGTAIKLWSDPKFGWVRRLLDEPRVAFSVFEHDVPRRAVYIRGTATVREGSMAALDDDIRAITARYVDAERLDEEIRSYDSGRNKVIVTITPTWIKGAYN